MKLTKAGIDRMLAIAGAVTAPALTLCVQEHALGAQAATTVGAIVAAALIAYHGGGLAQGATGGPSVPDDTTPA